MNRQQLLIIALLVSIGANLFFVGGISYRLLNAPERTLVRPFPANVGWIVRDLSEARRQELASLLEQSAEAIRPLRRQMFNAQRRVNALMAAPEFDAGQLRQAFTDLRTASEQYQQLSHRQTVQILAQLTEAERRLAQEFLQRRGPREGRRGFRGADGGPRPDSDRPPREPAR